MSLSVVDVGTTSMSSSNFIGMSILGSRDAAVVVGSTRSTLYDVMQVVFVADDDGIIDVVSSDTSKEQVVVVVGSLKQKRKRSVSGGVSTQCLLLNSRCNADSFPLSTCLALSLDSGWDGALTRCLLALCDTRCEIGDDNEEEEEEKEDAEMNVILGRKGE